jgi:hypothetical protein
MHKKAGEQVSVADLIREAIDTHLDKLNKEQENDTK